MDNETTPATKRLTTEPWCIVNSLLAAVDELERGSFTEPPLASLTSRFAKPIKVAACDVCNSVRMEVFGAVNQGPVKLIPAFRCAGVVFTL